MLSSILIVKDKSTSREVYDQLNKDELDKLLFNIEKICDSKLGTIHPKSVTNIENKKEGILYPRWQGSRNYSNVKELNA